MPSPSWESMLFTLYSRLLSAADFNLENALSLCSTGARKDSLSMDDDLSDPSTMSFAMAGRGINQYYSLARLLCSRGKVGPNDQGISP